MKSAEHVELERQGAKAATRGDHAHSNPLLQWCNRPRATGETAQQWGARYDAWQAGYDRQVVELSLPQWQQFRYR